ncbi:unnamed protein product [Phytophthora fragariaefolia]|uniref:Unnamed protein product n=1 Tax=Phytophthora fragariaefolia TaxID=1490495 RepID=A0A9W6XER0_9STRA|nr:unnamed protein product [Phytophthora fragariaefolia]
MVRESKSPPSSPTFCVRKPNGTWRMVHAFNELNAATIPASTPIPRKDVLQNNMAGCTGFSALDMVDGYYQLLMRESDIPLISRRILIPLGWDGRVLQFATELHVSRGHPPTQSVAAGSAHVEEGVGVVTRANKSGRVGTPTMQGVVAGSARATEGAGACPRATTGGRAGAPTSKFIRGDKVTSSPKAEASGRDADSAAEDRAPQVLDIFTGEPKVGGMLTPLPTVAELIELEELSYVEFLDTLKAGELAEVVLLRPEGGSLELNSSSVMDSEILEDEGTSRRQTQYGMPF